MSTKTLGPEDVKDLRAAYERYVALTSLDYPTDEALNLAYAEARPLLKKLKNAAPSMLDTIEALTDDHVTITQTPNGNFVVTSAKGDYDLEEAIGRAFSSMMSTLLTAATGQGWSVISRRTPDHDEPIPFSPVDESEPS